MTIGLLQVANSSVGWKDLPIGAGGYISGISISSDNTMVVRTDTYGGYLWNPSANDPVNGVQGTWQQICTSNALPVGFEPFGNGPVGMLWEVQVSWSNSNIIYMMFNDVTQTYPTNSTVYKSVDKGSTWTATTFTPINIYADDGGGEQPIGTQPTRVWGPKLVIDPTNPNIVYASTGANGLFYTLDGGGTWTNIATGVVPFATELGSTGVYPGYTLGIGVYNSVQYVLAFSYGNGVWLTSNGGSTWSNISSGGPTNITTTNSLQTVKFDRNTGYFYCVGGDGNAYQYKASSGSPGWTEIYSGGDAEDIAVDPNNVNHLVITNGDALAESTSSTPSFGTFAGGGQTVTTTNDCPWLAMFGPSAHRIEFDSSIAKKIWAATDRLVIYNTPWSGTLSSSDTLTWYSQSRGIEQMVANCVTVPSANSPLLGVWDSGLISGVNLLQYQAESQFSPGIVGGYPQLDACWSIDYAINNPNYIVALIDGGGLDGTNNQSVYTTTGSSGGKSSWTALPSFPSNAAGGGGCVAVSTSTNMIYAPGQVAPSYTLDGGNTWNLISVSGISSWTNMQNLGGRLVTADGATTGTFYLFYPETGFFVTTNGGEDWSSLVTFTNTTYSTRWIKATPGQAADFWCIPGGNTGSTLYHYYGGNLVTTNFQQAMAFGFGKNSSGNYPSVFAVGYETSPTGNYGVFRSDNAYNNASPTWNSLGEYPLGIIDSPTDISGDPGVYGKCYIGFGGTSFRYYNA